MKIRKQCITGCIVLLSMGLPLMANAQASPEADITNAMRAQAEAYFMGDFKKLRSLYVQDSSSSRTIISKFYYSSQIGWPNMLAKLIQNSQENGVHSVTVTYENVHIRTSGNLAFVEADERQTWPDLDPKLIPVVHTYRALVREKTGWKTANVIRVDPTSFANTPANREYELNSIGYELLSEKRVAEATDIFVLNVKLNPTSWNAYDSLGEAYALAGNTQQAITQYEKSLELNPKSEAGQKALARLKKQ